MNKKVWKRRLASAAVITSMAFASVFSISGTSSGNLIKFTGQTSQNQKYETSGELKVHFIDVGQGDSILIQQDDKNMLIDTGSYAKADSTVSYLKKQNIKKLDYLVLTHPHEDHMGGAATVINTFEIGTIYMPKVTANTLSYKITVNTMKRKGLKAGEIWPGLSFKLGLADCRILGPINPVSGDLNTYSIVIMITFGSNKFLLTGDAQFSNEDDMIKSGFDIAADVLKVGHHGSYTSTSQSFLSRVNPKYAVISCGKGNDYGHPHKVALNKLKEGNIKVFRTDEDGTVVITCDQGQFLNFSNK
jgi:competence protein ComEC